MKSKVTGCACEWFFVSYYLKQNNPNSEPHPLAANFKWQKNFVAFVYINFNLTVKFIYPVAETLLHLY